MTRNGFRKLGFNFLAGIALIFASLGQAFGQVAEPDSKPPETKETPELKEEKSEVTKPDPGSLKDFGILHTNNIFDPNRKPYRPGKSRRNSEPEPPIDAFTVIGFMTYTDRQIVVLNGSSSKFSGVFKLNDQIDNLKLISLNEKAATFAAGETNVIVNIGTGLKRVDGGAWKESNVRVSGSSRNRSSQGRDSSRSSRGEPRRDDDKDSPEEPEDKVGEGEDSQDSDAAEMLRKLRERRKQETGQ